MRTEAGRKEDGFVMVWALLLMVVLLILGLSGMGTSIFQAFMSANDALYKQSFYQADGGTNVAGMLIEENVSCASGFIQTTSSGGALIKGNVLVANRFIAMNPAPTGGATVSDALRDAYFFYDPTDPTGTTKPRTNIKAGGDTSLISGTGGASGMGYAGQPGVSSAQLGAAIDYVTYSEHKDVRQSNSTIGIIWQHLVGTPGECHY